MIKYIRYTYKKGVRENTYEEYIGELKVYTHYRLRTFPGVGREIFSTRVYSTRLVKTSARTESDR